MSNTVSANTNIIRLYSMAKSMQKGLEIFLKTLGGFEVTRNRFDRILQTLTASKARSVRPEMNQALATRCTFISVPSGKIHSGTKETWNNNSTIDQS